MTRQTDHTLISLDEDPISLFRKWMEQAAQYESDANAMILATATKTGAPSCRVVLLKDIHQGGFVFYTNAFSRKGRELEQNPQVALLFYWKGTHRQLRIEGMCRPTTAQESDHYFATRRRLSKIGAIASHQSRELKDRQSFEEDIARLSKLYPTDNVPRPDNWHGYLVIPSYFEFWQERPYRLHDRAFWRYQYKTETWKKGRLYP